MYIQRGLAISACVWQLMLQHIYSTYVCPHENDKYYDEGDTVIFLCAREHLLHVYTCHDNLTRIISMKQTIGNVSFKPDWWHRTKASAAFDYTVVGWFACTFLDVCLRREFILGRHMVTARYERHDNEDIFICETPFPDIVHLQMYIDGDDVPDHDVDVNGTIRYAAPLISNATCLGYAFCVDRWFTGRIFHFHHNNFTFVKNETIPLNCFRSGEGTTSLLPVKNDIGGRFSEHDDVTLIRNHFDESTLSGWCITVSDDSFYISDVFTLINAYSTSNITEILDKTAEVFVLDAGTSHVSFARGLSFIVICVVNAMLYQINIMF
ncbi:b149.8 [miniopterid betaherpesvirus 1]|uniref:B149.8 n=1 Tax=miniopterid betaherpesvirus 1 TaxID=3070189 RepID=I3VQE1_9BETA|nr:b149.8 [miniopterid betaherpesvirus 1]AFK83985.1 b149.8 [miniopterid betaherpesvirus 1]